MADEHSPSNTEEIPEEQFAAQLLAQVHACQPLMSTRDVEQVEQTASSAEFGTGRRVGLAIAAMDGNRFREVSTTIDRDTAAALAESLVCLGDYINRTEEMITWLQAAWLRLFTSLAARDDADSLGLETTVMPKFAKREEVAHG